MTLLEEVSRQPAEELPAEELPAVRDWASATAGERRAAALAAAEAAAAAGETMSGGQLGAMFDRSERWGRAVLEELGDGRPAAPAAAPAARQPAAARARRSSPAGRQPGGAAVPAGDLAAGRDGRPAAGSSKPERQPVGRPAAEEGRPPAAWYDHAIVLVVAVVAAVASYLHMIDVALAAGEPLWIARVWPITVDGLVLAALRRGERGRPWLLLGLAVSIAANVLSKYPEMSATLGPAISAFPAVALYGGHRLLHAGGGR